MSTITTTSSSSGGGGGGGSAAEVSRLRQVAERLRAEAAELRARLAGERGAVRALRAAHGSAERRQRAADRQRRAQLEAQLSEARRSAHATSTSAGNTTLPPGTHCAHCTRASHELTKQKELVKDLEAKLQKVVEADKLKATNLRAQHDKHIAEISKITRIHKQEAHKLLEELKTKDRLIEQLRKKVVASIEPVVQGSKRPRDSDKKKSASVASDPNLLDQISTNEQNSTKQQGSGRKRRRGESGDIMSPQESEESATPSAEEETDSAVSSAPSSLSPQPCSPNAADTVTHGPFGVWTPRDDDLERALFVKQSVKSGRLRERLLSLEAREAELLRELSDLRDQNELLEFRVLELTNRLDDEDFPSVCPRGATRDMSTDTDDMPLDPGGEPVRHSLVKLARQVYDPQDVCNLLHAAALLDALETLSKRQPSDIAFGQDMEVTNMSTLPLQVHKGDRQVATVPPFRRRDNTVQEEEARRPEAEEEVEEEEEEEDVEDEFEQKKKQEDRSGECNSRGTQTESEVKEDGMKSAPLDLAAEVRKLDRLRESLEQRQQRQLEFYRGRVDALERKVRVYESSGERQARHLAERLARELRLAAQVEQLAATVTRLQALNSRLEEERCELEEAENDTRLRCQRLQAELHKLARSRMAAKRRARDARSHASHWETLAGRYEQRNYELEERECELRHRLDVLEKTAPALLLFGAWKRMHADSSGAPAPDVIAAAVQKLAAPPAHAHTSATPPPRAPTVRTTQQQQQQQECECVCRDDEQKQDEQELNPERGGSVGSASSLDTRDLDLVRCVEQLKERELDMRRRILELERREAAYMETLQQADEIWAQMEGGYKDRLNVADRTESELRERLRRLEERAPLDEERVSELEESERRLAARVAQLERDNNRLRSSVEATESEAAERAAAAERRATELATEAERERRRSRELENELRQARDTFADAGRRQEDETSALREQLARARHALVHLEVTNGELREEVSTLEVRVAELGREAAQRAAQDERIVRDLTDELLEKTAKMEDMRRVIDSAKPTPPPSPVPPDDDRGDRPPTKIHPKPGTESAPCLRLQQAVCELKCCEICSEIVEPDLVETAEGLTSLCKVVHTGSGLSTASSPPDIQPRRRRR